MKSTNEMQTSNAEMVTISRAEYEKLLGQEQQLLTQNERHAKIEQQIEVLMEALRLARHKQFGSSSEKREDALMEQLSFLFNEAEVFSSAEKEEAENVTVVADHTRYKKHEYTLDSIPEGMPVEQVEHRLEGEDLECPQCGETMTEIAKEVVRTMKIILLRQLSGKISIIPTPVSAAVKALTKVVRPCCKDSPGEEYHPRQLCYTGGHCPYHDTEVCYGFSSVSAGTGD